MHKLVLKSITPSSNYGQSKKEMYTYKICHYKLIAPIMISLEASDYSIQNKDRQIIMKGAYPSKSLNEEKAAIIPVR